MKFLSAIIGIIFLLSACNGIRNPTSVYTSNMDKSVNPANDFFSYANGGWLGNNPIPPDESAWGIGTIVINENYERLRLINEEAVTMDEGGNNRDDKIRKIADYWRVAMDTAKIEKQGLHYLQPWLDKIDAVTDSKEFMRLVAGLYKIGVKTVVDISVVQDPKNSDRYILRIDQGGLGLPEKEYYLSQNEGLMELRMIYRDHLSRVLQLMGEDTISALKNAQSIYTLETRFALFSRKLEDLSDPYINYHKLSVRELANINKVVDWRDFLDALGVGDIDSVIAGQPGFLFSLDQAMAATPVEILKRYLECRLFDYYSEMLPDKFSNEGYSFKKWVLGIKQQRPRWKRVVADQQRILGQLTGQIFVNKYFDSLSRKRYENMAEGIRNAYALRVSNLDWMSEATKEKALRKVNAITIKVGYPDTWQDLSNLEISDDSYLQNVMNGEAWLFKNEIQKLNMPVDRSEWKMLPQTYDAYYDYSNNEIVFPAAGFFIPEYNDPQLDDAIMFGYIGASFFGHEITHALDDVGRMYDLNGNLNNWWTREDSISFEKRARLIVQQFNSYEPVEGFHINGEATMNQNIADLAGLEIALTAFRDSRVFKDNVTINGYTPLERFFIGYAMSWMYSTRPEKLRDMIITDIHSPARYRVNGPLSNISEFYSTYKVGPGNRMYRPDSVRVNIW